MPDETRETMPNAEGKVEITERDRVNLVAVNVAALRSWALDGHNTEWMRGAIGIVCDALAARTREVEEMRAALTTINALYDDLQHIAELSLRFYDAANIASRALAAQEGTR